MERKTLTYALANQAIGAKLERRMTARMVPQTIPTITAVTVVTTAHHTRLLTAQREQLVLERDALDIEWRNLILEENALGDHSRVERIATEKLQMQHVDPSQENIVVQK
ncbi:cell division protein FtsL [Salmonella enterica subsp. enterica serovar Braenderup]|nr:cell division protein FtsL [Salmonella enterica]EED9106759.1 cell division protein FtsL [Salmonella enterica subsp. enterica serovar Braenderup]